MRHLMVYWIAIGILSPTSFLRAQVPLAPPLDLCKVGKQIVSTRSKHAIIVLLDEHGKFTGGDNTFCLDFRNAADSGSIDIRSVSMEFAQMVGRIQQRPIVTELSQIGVGKYLGHVNLGRQFYKPAVYYALVHYMDLDGKTRKARFLLTVE